MIAYVLRRLVGTIPTMLLVTLTVFIIMRLTPGGPAVAMLGEQASPQAVAALKEKLGLNRPSTSNTSIGWVTRSGAISGAPPSAISP